MPAATNPHCLLAKHECGLIQEARQQLASFKGGHRSPEYNNFLLPRCRAIVEAMGHRMGYEAARQAGLPEDILSLYEASVMDLDISWYIENQHTTRARHAEMESAALDSLLSRLDTLLEDTGAAEYVSAPMVSKEKWKTFVEPLPVYSGNASFDLETAADVKVETKEESAIEGSNCFKGIGRRRKFNWSWSGLFRSFSRQRPRKEKVDWSD